MPFPLRCILLFPAHRPYKIGEQLIREQVLPIAVSGITLGCMTSISLKLPDILLREVEAEARRRRLSKSALIRESLETTLRRQRRRKRLTCLDLAGDLAGKFKGPPDFSTNRKYLEEAILADSYRGRKNSR